MFYFILTLYCLGSQILPSCAKFYDLADAEAFYNDYLKAYNKNYTMPEERNLRFEIFKNNLEYYNAVNKKHNAHVNGINMFSDLDAEEFERLYLIPMTGDSEKIVVDCEKIPPTDYRNIVPENDYTSLVTPAKTQRGPTCSIYATIANVEAQYTKVNHQMIPFSEQQLLDCIDNDRGHRHPAIKMDYLVKAGGSMTQEAYPTEEKPGICRFSPEHITARVTGCRIFFFTTEGDIKKILYRYGPVAIRVSAKSWKRYKGGVYPASLCKPDVLNHSVLLVGYGTENGKDYWLIKNSWGTKFGENGLIKIERNKNACNILGSVEGSRQIISSVVVASRFQGVRANPVPTDERSGQILAQ